MTDKVIGRCPACLHESLFLGGGGHVTCSWSQCSHPDAASLLLQRAARTVDEPRFTIRAQDALAPLAVEAWASFAELAGRATGVDHLEDQAREARAIANEMRDWHAAHPDRVKWPD